MTAAPHPKITSWRFALPLLLQILLVLLIPAQAAYTYFSGESVILQTVPVDPYSLLQGYYVILRYDISQTDTLDDLPGWAEINQSRINSESSFLEGTDPFYVVLEPPDSPSADDGEIDTTARTPRPWTPVRVVGDRPPSLTSNQVALQARYSSGSRVIYGVEKYFIPEDQRNDINDRIREAQQSGDPQAYVVEVNVTPNGKAVLTTLWIEGEAYRF